MNELLYILEKQRGVELSGQALGERLGVTRAAVWKGIDALRREGYIITSLPGRGYLFDTRNDKMSAEGVLACMQQQEAAYFSPLLTVLESVGSTNTELKALAEAGAAAGRVLVAQSQSSGRGRRGRQFYSPPGGGVYLSMLLRPDRPAADCTALTAAAAVAVAEALDRYARERVQIKWVNDLFVRGLKVCGILTEGSIELDGEGISYAVVGVGINLSGSMPEELRGIAGTVCEGTAPPRNRACAEVLTAMRRVFAELEQSGKGAVIERYRDRSFVIGREVRVISPCLTRIGRVAAIDDDARLVVDFPEGRETVGSGEISLRLCGTPNAG